MDFASESNINKIYYYVFLILFERTGHSMKYFFKALLMF